MINIVYDGVIYYKMFIFADINIKGSKSDSNTMMPIGI
jgi:hypothetical protein